jgi:hypothetical protein
LCVGVLGVVIVASKYCIVGSKVGEAEYLEPAESKVPKIGEASQLEASPKLRIRWDVEI